MPEVTYLLCENIYSAYRNQYKHNRKRYYQHVSQTELKICNELTNGRQSTFLSFWHIISSVALQPNVYHFFVILFPFKLSNKVFVKRSKHLLIFLYGHHANQSATNQYDYSKRKVQKYEYTDNKRIFNIKTQYMLENKNEHVVIENERTSCSNTAVWSEFTRGTTRSKPVTMC